MGPDKNIVIENANIGRGNFRNFAGRPTRFTPEGKRSFHVFFDDPDLVAVLEQDGWPIKYLQPRDPNDAPAPHMEVAVNFGGRVPPKIVLITSHGKTLLTEDTVGSLDWAEIKNVDVVIRPYNYDFAGKKGTKPYLKTMYVTIEEDELERKYYDDPTMDDEPPFDM